MISWGSHLRGNKPFGTVVQRQKDEARKAQFEADDDLDAATLVASVVKANASAPSGKSINLMRISVTKVRDESAQKVKEAQELLEKQLAEQKEKFLAVGSGGDQVDQLQRSAVIKELDGAMQGAVGHFSEMLRWLQDTTATIRDAQSVQDLTSCKVEIGSHYKGLWKGKAGDMKKNARVQKFNRGPQAERFVAENCTWKQYLTAASIAAPFRHGRCGVDGRHARSWLVHLRVQRRYEVLLRRLCERWRHRDRTQSLSGLEKGFEANAESPLVERQWSCANGGPISA